MTHFIDRREFLKIAGLGGAVLVGGAGFGGRAAAARADDFYFVQLSDLHWGFEGPAQNPDSTGTLHKAIAGVNALKEPPDFVVFTGDLTHTTEDGKVRRQRMDEVRSIIGELKVKDVKFMPGEHDASLDHGKAFQEFFGATHYSFDHKGVHFVALDNVSDPGASIGSDQLAWLAADLDRQPKDARIVVFTHRPLFDLYPQWDWATTDGAKAIEILQTRDNVTVFYGHIHQEHHFKTGAIEHHAAKGLMFALPAPGSQLKRTPVAWDPAVPYKGLGYREVEAEPSPVRYDLTELPVVAS
ncbi:MAG TPA: metallophosphoesterase [Casimicrobiaceae bacterium]|nr:metallophosphoesterase [Casimicrobiaceae bacterium]